MILETDKHSDRQDRAVAAPAQAFIRMWWHNMLMQMSRDLQSDESENSADNNDAETPAEMARVIRRAGETGERIVVHGEDGKSIDCVFDMLLEDRRLAAEKHRRIKPPHGVVSAVIIGGYVHEQLDAATANVSVEEGESGGWQETELAWARGPTGDGTYDEWQSTPVERIEVVSYE